MHPGQYLCRSPHSVSYLCAAAVAAISLLVLLGWQFDIASLQRILSRSVAMNPLTALCFLSLGGSILLLAGKGEHSSLVRGAAGLLVGIPFAAGALRLAGYLLGIEAGADRILFSAKLDNIENGLPNRMAPNTAFCFVLASTAIQTVSHPSLLRRTISQGAAVLLFFMAFVSFLGYTVNAPGLYQPLPYIGMAINTAVCFLLISLGILSMDPGHGLAAVVTSPLAGGKMARRVLPAAILVPLVIGWVMLWGLHRSHFRAEFAMGVLMISCVLLLGLFTLQTAAALNWSETEHLRAEEAVRQNAVRLEHALDISESAILSIDSNQRIIAFDERAERLFGYSREEVVGAALDVLIPERFAPTHREHVERFAAAPETARKMGSRREVFGLRKDGTEFPAEAAISKGVRDGRLILTVVVHDMSDRARVMEEMVQRERLLAANQELESFSYSVSHDLRAPLRHIDGFIQLLKKRAWQSVDEQSRRYLDTISESAREMGMLIDDLLAFSRTARTEMNLEPTPLLPLVEQAIREQTAGTEGRTIEWRIEELPWAVCDPTLVRLVISNLVANAVKFTRGRNPARIEICALEGPQKEVIVRVTDNGVGFDMRYHDKIFGVFQRLHRQEEFEGTGIGLATVRRILRRHGGDVWAESEVDRGSSFFFSLPAKQEATT